jgi:thiol-disulfide isomerase/thioredoxin
MNKKMLRQMFAFSGLVLLLSVVFIYFKFFVQPNISYNHVKVNDLNGNKVDINEYLGKPLVVNYWATWCGPCIHEFTHFQEVKNELGESVIFIMISDESIEKISTFSQSKPYDFIYLRSSKNLSEYGIYIRPTTYFYNSKGELINKYTSNLDSNTLKEFIKEII